MMTLTNWSESSWWLAAGWTMLQFLWIGGLLWIAAAGIRATSVRFSPSVRYAVSLGLQVITAGVPVVLFISALSSPPSAQFMQAEPPTAVMPLHAAKHTGVPMLAPLDGKVFQANGLRNGLFAAYRWLPGVWFTGTILTLAILSCGVIGADRLRSGSRLLEQGEVAAACQRLRTALQIGRQVAVAACDRIAGPLLVGIVRPMILLPPSVIAECSPDQMEMILIHELAHVRRWDNLINLGQRLIEALLFFHPVIWWFSSWVRLTREECCDSVVVAHTGAPQAYAETLAGLAMPGIMARQTAMAMTDTHLSIRIRHILNLGEESMSVSRKGWQVAVGVLIVAVGVGAWQIHSARETETGIGERSNSARKSAGDSQAASNGTPSGINRVAFTMDNLAGPARYRVEPPDVLSIEVVNSVRRDELRPGAEVVIRASGTLAVDPNEDPVEKQNKQIKGTHVVQPDGTVDLGPEYGSVKVEGLTLLRARVTIIEHLRAEAGLSNPKVAVSFPDGTPRPPVSGDHLVRRDGTVSLGTFGSVHVAGMTLEEVKTAIEEHLAKSLPQPEVKVGVLHVAQK
jgi:beta-lactamase regulating signal transducer with metallopeptidase domain/protein involved in polysaccharide export with SLBB domain